MPTGTLSVEILSPRWRRVPPETSTPSKVHSHDAAFSAVAAHTRCVVCTWPRGCDCEWSIYAVSSPTLSFPSLCSSSDPELQVASNQQLPLGQLDLFPHLSSEAFLYYSTS